jgi:hypothetical protein
VFSAFGAYIKTSHRAQRIALLDRQHFAYLQIVENRREKGKVTQWVIATLGRQDQMTAKGEVEALVRSLSRFSERTLLILSDQSKGTVVSSP